MIIRIQPARRHQGRGYRPMWLMSAIAVTCLLAPAARGASEERLRETFRQLDTNADGQVSTTEFANRKIYVFSLHDANGDNVVQRDEVDLDAHQFQALDKDGDGRISGFEFIEASMGRFETYDTDGNGSMTFEELVTSARASASRP